MELPRVTQLVSEDRRPDGPADYSNSASGLIGETS
jgi:hypothetical protein